MEVFETSTGAEIRYFCEDLVLRKVRHWRSQGQLQSEAWFARPDGTEVNLNGFPLNLEGREGHRYRLCWAATPGQTNWSLVGASNLTTQRYQTIGHGKVLDELTDPAYGRHLFWFTAAVALLLAFWPGLDHLRAQLHPAVAWWHLVAAPFLTGTLGLSVSCFVPSLDPEGAFDEELSRILFDDA